MKTANLPIKVKIASPCPTRWEDMGGDERIRFCDHCRKNVYNLSAMTATEATDLLKAKNGNLCARIYQRTDGTVLTEDCPVGVAKYWGQVKTVLAGCVAAFLIVFGCASAIAGTKNSGGKKKGPIGLFVDDSIYKVKGWLGMNPQPVMLLGKVCAAPTTPARPLVGEVSVPPPPQPKATPTPPAQPKK